MSGAYSEFLAQKAVFDPPTGIVEPPDLTDVLFPFQADIVRWALRRGRAALFAGTGLGKSLMELSWGHAVSDATGKPVLLLAPLAVSHQMQREGAKFDLPVALCKSQAEVPTSGVAVTNYAKLEHFDLSRFGGVILDESSILKASNGVTRTALIEGCKSVPFRLAATATPAPNDFMELGNHAEFLGVMSYTDMLATFFVHDGGETQKWRLRGHAEEAFWKWMCQWAVMLRHPRDLGYEQDGYDLPPLLTHQHTVAVEYKPSMETGLLFPVEAKSLSERLGARRSTVNDRVAAAVAIANGNDRQWVVWCNINTESEALSRAIDGAAEVRGSDSDDVKERRIADFIVGRARVLVTKPSICGYGLNLQFCQNTIFVGLNDSFEQLFQAIRRFWRFGQTMPVNVHFIASEIEGAVVANIRRKEADAEHMVDAMVKHMADINAATIRGLTRDRLDYQPAVAVSLPSWLSGVAA